MTAKTKDPNFALRIESSISIEICGYQHIRALNLAPNIQKYLSAKERQVWMEHRRKGTYGISKVQFAQIGSLLRMRCSQLNRHTHTDTQHRVLFCVATKI